MTSIRKILPVLLSAIQLCITGVLAVETPMQNVPAYTTAIQKKPCATECAIVPSDAFKTKYTCNVVDAVSCICANATASVELRSSMSQYCYDHCDGVVGPHLATAILDGYCAQFSTGRTTDPPHASPTSTTSTEIPNSTTTTPPAPDGGLSSGAVIALATVIPGVTLIVTVLGAWNWDKVRPWVWGMVRG